MRKIILLMSIILLISSCSSDNNQSENDNGFAISKIYKQQNNDFGKVVSGIRNEFSLKGFGEFKSVLNSNDYIPKNIKFIEQSNINNGIRNIIKLDENYFPKEFYQIENNVILDTIYHIHYNEERILINHDILNSDGTFTTHNSTTFAGISANRMSARIYKSNSNADCDDPLSEDGDFHPCSNNSIYQQFADDAQGSTYFIMQQVGIAIEWLVESFTENVCNSSQNRTAKTNKSRLINLSCDDYQINDIDEDICQILQNCNTDCNGELYGSAYLDSCDICVGGNTNQEPCNNQTDFYFDIDNQNWQPTEVTLFDYTQDNQGVYLIAEDENYKFRGWIYNYNGIGTYTFPNTNVNNTENHFRLTDKTTDITYTTFCTNNSVFEITSIDNLLVSASFDLKVCELNNESNFLNLTNGIINLELTNP